MLLFRLKRMLMGKVLKKRAKEQSFDYDYADNYSLEGETDPLLNNSYYFSAHDERMSVFVRLGRRIHVEETWFAVYLDGRLYTLKQELYPGGEAPLLVKKNGEHWTVSYQGIVNEKDDVSFHATFIATGKPIEFGCDMPAVRKATAIANEKWSKAFFQQLQTINGQCHYEQEGVLEGQMTLNGRTVDFSLPCVRDHSFGKRDWDYMNNHLWLMAVSPARQFNYSFVSYPAMSALEVGHERDEAGLHFLLQSNLDFHQINKGTVPQELSFQVRLDNGKTIPVAAKVLTGVTYHFQDDRYVLHEQIAEFVIDGARCRGILEIGFNGNSRRFFNQRDLETIKR